MPRKVKKKVRKRADGLAAVVLLVGLAALAIGYYIQVQLRAYRIFHLFTATERSWRDQAFEVALYSCIAAGVLFLGVRLIRRS